MRWFWSVFLGIMCFGGSLIAEQEVHQVVILGSGPAGLTSAIYTSRAGLSSLVIEGEEPGGQISLSYTVENFPGFSEGISGEELGKKMRAQAVKFGTRIQSGKVIAADLSRRPFKLKLDNGKEIFAEALILASGASPKWLGLASERALIGKGVGSCAVCDAALYKGKETVVIGGGDSALQDALLLAKHAKKVSLVHRSETFRGSKYLQDQVFAAKNIDVIWNSVVDEIKDPVEKNVTGVVLKDLKTNEKRLFPCEGVIVAIGHAPNTGLFRGQIDLNDEGYVVTDAHSRATKIPGIFVAGDLADAKYRQAVTAAGDGCKAGLDAYDFLQKNPSKLLAKPEVKSVVQTVTHAESAPREIVSLSKENMESLMQGDRPLVLDVYSDHCGYCRHLSPIFETLNREMGGSYQFAKANIDYVGNLLDGYKIKSFPTILFIKNGKEIGRHVGFMNKETFQSEIERYLGK